MSCQVVTILGPEDIKAGGSDTLTCRADGLPDSLTLMWVRERGSPIPNKHQLDDRNGILVLQRFDQSDAGQYTCQIKSINDGRVVAEASITVMIREFIPNIYLT